MSACQQDWIGIDVDGHNDVLGFRLSEDESSWQWIRILEKIKRRGVENILFSSLDGLPGLADAIKTIYPQTTTQRCIRKNIKAVYKAVSVDETVALFEVFQTK